jgi:hypothetical protein
MRRRRQRVAASASATGGVASDMSMLGPNPGSEP